MVVAASSVEFDRMHVPEKHNVFAEPGVNCPKILPDDKSRKRIGLGKSEPKEGAKMTMSGAWWTELLSRIFVELLALFFGGMLGGALLKLVTGLLEKYPPQQTSMARCKAIGGQWRGTITQNGGRHATMPVDFKFEVGWRVIKGQFSFDPPKPYGGKVTNTFRGRFITDNIFQLEYKKETPHITRGFGTILLKCSPELKTMAGRVVGL